MRAGLPRIVIGRGGFALGVDRPGLHTDHARMNYRKEGKYDPDD
jgi:hypothetical protein